MRELQSVLYVDDDPDICAVVEATLRLIGKLTVHLAGSGEIAIQRAAERRPDLILMDVMMPGLDGPSTLKRMRQDAGLGDIPVMFLTAKVMPAEIEHLLHLGACGVIAKPFDPARLCADLISWWRAARGAPPAAALPPGDGLPPGDVPQIPVQPASRSGEFLARASGDVEQLRSLLERLAQGEVGLLEDIERLSHRIHGAASIFGLPQVGECGGAIEALAARAKADMAAAAHQPACGLIDEMRACTQSLDAAVRAAASSLSTIPGAAPA